MEDVIPSIFITFNAFALTAALAAACVIMAFEDSKDDDLELCLALSLLLLLLEDEPELDFDDF